MDYMLIPLKGEPPYRVFENQDTPDAAIEYAAIMAPSQGEIKIWQALMLVRLKPDIIDLTIPVAPEPPRRGRPRKTATPPETPATPPGIIFDSSPYHDDVYREPFYGNEKLAAPAALLIDSYGCAQDPDGIYRACIVYTRDGVTGSAIGKHEIDERAAAMIALANMDLMFMADLEALPDTEGKRQVLAAVGAKDTSD